MTEADRTTETPKKAKEPSYSITVEATGDILELAIRGRATAENAAEIRDAVIDIAKDHQKPLLVDVRGLAGRLSVSQTYYHVRNQPPAPPIHKTAVIDLSENAEYDKFHEVTATNAGLMLRYFNTPEEGRAWLRE